MRVNRVTRWGEYCLDCGHISVRNSFRCEKCKSGNNTEQQYVICAAEDEGCRRRVRVKDLADHLARVHPIELANCFCEDVLRLYDLNARPDEMRTREFSAERLYKRRPKKLPGEQVTYGGRGLHKTRKF